eukprot:9937005-Alexandrium_andersonii.AAC.1
MRLPISVCLTPGFRSTEYSRPRTVSISMYLMDRENNFPSLVILLVMSNNLGRNSNTKSRLVPTAVEGL